MPCRFPADLDLVLAEQDAGASAARRVQPITRERAERAVAAGASEPPAPAAYGADDPVRLVRTSYLVQRAAIRRTETGKVKREELRQLVAASLAAARRA